MSVLYKDKVAVASSLTQLIFKPLLVHNCMQDYIDVVCV